MITAALVLTALPFVIAVLAVDGWVLAKPPKRPPSKPPRKPIQTKPIR